MNKRKIHAQKSNCSDELKPFNRILIRDSTTQELPALTYDHFKGLSFNDKPVSLTRIQALFNFTEEKWEHFSVDAYTENDQKVANQIASQLQPGDLLLQDLGYFTLDWLGQLTEKQYVITKWDNRTLLMDENRTPLGLLKLFKSHSEIDMPVLVGKNKRIPMRMVVKKLPKKEAIKRIKKARKDRHRDTNHSEQYYELLKYEIYLTNVDHTTLNIKQIAKLYGLRWHIEILFKSWKSYANFKKMFPRERMKLHRVLFTIYAMLILFVYISDVYKYIEKKICRKEKQNISALKFMDVAVSLIDKILVIKKMEDINPYLQQFAKHAMYQKRKNRKNTADKYLYTRNLCKAA